MIELKAATHFVISSYLAGELLSTSTLDWYCEKINKNYKKYYYAQKQTDDGVVAQARSLHRKLKTANMLDKIKTVEDINKIDFSELL